MLDFHLFSHFCELMKTSKRRSRVFNLSNEPRDSADKSFWVNFFEKLFHDFIMKCFVMSVGNVSRTSTTKTTLRIYVATIKDKNIRGQVVLVALKMTSRKQFRFHDSWKHILRTFLFNFIAQKYLKSIVQDYCFWCIIQKYFQIQHFPIY